MDMITIDKNSYFSIQNIHFGIYSINGGEKHVAVAYGDSILDLYVLTKLGLFVEYKVDNSIFTNNFLNNFIALGKVKTSGVRRIIQGLLKNEGHPIWAQNVTFLFKQVSITLHLPIKIGDYTDFYSSESHARNVGMMFPDP
jgi:fumarylacetoacetase